MMARHPDQLSLLDEPVFPVRAPVASIDLDRFRSSLKRAMAQAIRECPHSRTEIAARMAKYLLLANISKNTLDQYTAESKSTHDISLVRFKAFVKATGAVWLWDFIVADDGLTMLQGDEARLAEIARLQQEQRAISQEIKVLQSKPIIVKRGQNR